MRTRHLAAALAAVPVTAVLAACGSAAPAPAPSSAMPAAYTQAVTAMTAHCKQDAAQIGNMVAETHTLEVKAGITDESVTQLAVNLSKAVSGYRTPVDCADPFGAYVTLREGGNG